MNLSDDAMGKVDAAYEAAELRYLEQLAARADHPALSEAARVVAEAARSCYEAAVDFHRGLASSSRASEDDLHRADLQEDMTEMLAELWADVADAYAGRLPSADSGD